MSLMALAKITLELLLLSGTNLVYQMDPFAENSNTTWTSYKNNYLKVLEDKQSDRKYILAWSGEDGAPHK